MLFQICVEFKAMTQLCVDLFCTVFIELLFSIDSAIPKKNLLKVFHQMIVNKMMLNVKYTKRKRNHNRCL